LDGVSKEISSIGLSEIVGDPFGDNGASLELRCIKII